MPDLEPKSIGWNIETLREDILARISGNDVRYDQRFRAAEQAVAKAESANEKRFEGVNEFRSALGDQQRSLMPRMEAETAIRAISEKLDALTKQIGSRLDSLATELSTMRGSEGGKQHGWALAVGVVGLILTVLSIASVSVVLLHSTPGLQAPSVQTR